MKIGALEFWCAGEHGEVWAPTRMWAWAPPSAKAGDKDAWEMVLSPPDPAGGSMPIHDLKRWMLFGEKEERWFQLPSNARGTVLRRVHRKDAVCMYLRALWERLPEAKRNATPTLLMPAIDDEKARKRYLEAITQDFPNARVFPEPEMVVEYFRLVQRSLTLDEHRNNVILVMDIGASTSNLTIVISNRGDQVVGGESGRQRAGRLQAIQGASGHVAGQWVDEHLARQAGIATDALKDEAERLAVLERFESAKIAVSRSGEPQAVGAVNATPWILRPEYLEDAARRVVAELDPVLARMSERLWAQQTKTDTARALSEPTRRERGVSGPADALKLVDVVLLAGGTSRLRGFRQALNERISQANPRILEVGDSFPVAAAVGALAHVLHEKYNPPRIRSSESEGARIDASRLEGALETDIEFAWKREGDREQRQVVLERGDPFVYTGGERENLVQLTVANGTRLQARLLPRMSTKPSRKGLKMHRITPKRSNATVGIRVDANRHLAMISKQVEGVSTIRLDLNRFQRTDAPPINRQRGPVTEGHLAIDEANEVVIDFGMSKTVVVTPTAGLLQPAMLEGRSASVARAQQAADERFPAEGPNEDTGRSSATTGEVKLASTAASNEAPATPEPPSEAEHPRGQGADGDAVLTPSARSLVRSVDGFIDALRAFFGAADERRVDVPQGDLVFSLLGLAARRFLLLAGPPGCGKSTLARVIAHLLGRVEGDTFHEIAVQPHWVDDEPIFGHDGTLRPLVTNNTHTHLVLFDEINMTRPEYYLTRFFHAIESNGRSRPELLLGPTLGIGTLNIDETSRAPSPKVLDRCFLVEVDQVNHAHTLSGWTLDRLADLPMLPGLPEATNFEANALDPRIDRLLKMLEDAVRQHGLREDLLPSRRVLGDIRAVMALHSSLGTGAEDLLPRDELVDRLIASRILVKLSGAVDQLDPALRAVEKFKEDDDVKTLLRTARRISLSRQQSKLGFVSPWQ